MPPPPKKKIIKGLFLPKNKRKFVKVHHAIKIPKKIGLHTFFIEALDTPSGQLRMMSVSNSRFMSSVSYSLSGRSGKTETPLPYRCSNRVYVVLYVFKTPSKICHIMYVRCDMSHQSRITSNLLHKHQSLFSPQNEKPKFFANTNNVNKKNLYVPTISL